MSTTDKLDIGGWKAVLKEVLKEIQLDDKDITSAAQWLLNRKFFTKSSLNTRTWRSQAVDDFAVIVSDGGIAAINTYLIQTKQALMMFIISVQLVFASRLYNLCIQLIRC